METKRDYLEQINLCIKNAQVTKLAIQSFYITALKYYLNDYRKKFIDNE